MSISTWLLRLVPLLLIPLAGCQPDDYTKTPSSSGNPPILEVSATSLAFNAQQGSAPAPQTITIRNAGEGTLAWTASPGSAWLSLGSTSGSLAAGTSTQVSISLNTSGMGSGTYTGTLQLSASGATGSPQSVGVTLVVTPAPALEASVPSLTFSARQDSTPAAQSFTIHNSGGGTLAWTAVARPAWLSVTPSSGSVAAGASMPVAVAANTAALPSGTHNGTIELTAPGATGSPRMLGVTLAISAPPALTLSPASLSFAMQQGADPAGQALTITNTGGGTLAWSASEAIPWLVGSPASGSLAPGQSGALNLSVNAGDLAPGSYTGSITVAAPGASGAPRTVEVTLTVTRAPTGALEVGPAELAFSTEQGSSPAAQTLTIRNTGSGALTWSASEPIAWLVGSPAGGSLAPGQSASMSIAVNSADLAAGRYTGAITFAAPGATGSPRSVDVTLTVTPPALLPAPLLGAPSNGASAVKANPVFTWSPVSGADRYWLMVATDPAVFPTDPGATSCPGCVISGNTGATSYTAPAGFPYQGRTATLNANTRYYWRVQAWHSSPVRQGSYPAAFSFTTAPEPTLRIDGKTSSTRAIGETFVLSGSGFTPNGGVTRYLRDPNGNLIVLTPPATADASGNIGWSFAPVCTTPLGTGKLWARDDVSGQVSDTVTQIITAGSSCAPSLLPAPSLTAPSAGATGVSVNPTFSWSAVSGANRYWLMVATDPSAFPTNPNATTCPGCVISGNTGSTSYTTPAGFPYSGRAVTLNANTRYYWKVQAWSSSPDRQGNYSGAGTFTTAAAAGPPPARVAGSRKAVRPYSTLASTCGSTRARTAPSAATDRPA